MGVVEQVHIFGLTNIHTFEENNSLIWLFSLIFNYAIPRMSVLKNSSTQVMDVQSTAGYSLMLNTIL